MSVSVMKKLSVYACKSDADRIVRRLIQKKCVNIEVGNPDKAEGLTVPSYDLPLSECEDRLARVKSAIDILKSHEKKKGGLFPARPSVDRTKFRKDGSYEKAWDAVNAANGISESMDKLLVSRSHYQSIAELVTPWLSYDASLGVTGTKTTEILFGSLPPKTDTDVLSASLGELNAYPEIVSKDSGAVYIAVTVAKDDLPNALTKLNEFGFVRVTFGKIRGTAEAALAECQKKIGQNQKKYTEKAEELSNCAASLSLIEALYDVEEDEHLTLLQKQKLLETRETVFLTGWAPEDTVGTLSELLDRYTCAYDFADPGEYEEPPVFLKNNSFARNFEWVVGMYSYPKYGRYDPTFVMSIFYMLIFGMMFADVGYGLIVTLVCFLAAKYLPLREGLKRSAMMFGYCGIACAVMGVIFGGWFGDFPATFMTNFLGWSPDDGVHNGIYAFFNGLWFNPLDDPITFLVVSIATGAVHMITGMALRFIILCKDGKPLDAVVDVGSWWLIFAGIGMFFLNQIAATLLLSVGLLMLILMSGRAEKNWAMRILKGFGSLYDVTSYLSDLLSYSRILALGISASVIAQVVNMLGTMGGPTVMGFVTLVIAFLVGHTLNLAINLLGSFVHTGRLQYLEFFNKFYEDGGVPFEPVAPSDQYTVDISPLPGADAVTDSSSQQS